MIAGSPTGIRVAVDEGVTESARRLIFGALRSGRDASPGDVRGLAFVLDPAKVSLVLELYPTLHLLATCKTSDIARRSISARPERPGQTCSKLFSQ